VYSFKRIKLYLSTLYKYLITDPSSSKQILEYILGGATIKINLGRAGILSIASSKDSGLVGRARALFSKIIEAEVMDLISAGKLEEAAEALGLDSIHIAGDDGVVIKDGWEIHGPRDQILTLAYHVRANFVKKIYGSPRGGEVIDIGAWVGDTSVYFAALGNRVIALEPVERYYRYLVKNVEMNKLSGRIYPLHRAYSKERGEVYIRDMGTASRISAEGDRVEAINLEYLYTRYRLNEPFIKVDCEGCEYELVEELTLNKYRFAGMCIEIHRELGDHNKLVETLKHLGLYKAVVETVETTIACVKPRK